MKLQNKIAVVTGGAQGIGAAISTRFAEEGAKVVIVDINEEKSKTLATQLNASYVLCDVSNAEQVDNLFKKVIEQHGRLDILVNNAALVHHPDSNKNFLELTQQAWQRALDINLTGMFLCSQRAGRIMVKQVSEGKSTTGGCIINMSSGGGMRAHRHLMAYDTTKGGIEAATRAMAVDMAPWKIRVNVVVPGNITVDNALGGATAPKPPPAPFRLADPARRQTSPLPRHFSLQMMPHISPVNAWWWMAAWRRNSVPRRWMCRLMQTGLRGGWGR